MVNGSLLTNQRQINQLSPSFDITHKGRAGAQLWAPFTRVRTDFCTDEFCSWTNCLHGSVQILLQITVVFTWLRANCKTSHFCIVVLFLLFLLFYICRQNITRFQAFTALSVQKVAGSGVYTGPYEIGTVPVKKLTCFFQVPTYTWQI